MPTRSFTRNMGEFYWHDENNNSEIHWTVYIPSDETDRIDAWRPEMDTEIETLPEDILE